MNRIHLHPSITLPMQVFGIISGLNLKVAFTSQVNIDLMTRESANGHTQSRLASKLDSVSCVSTANFKWDKIA